MTETPHLHRPRHVLAISVAVVTLFAVVGLPAVGPASAQSGDARSQREKVRSDKASVATEVDALRADDSQVRGALDALNDNVRGQQAAYSDAKNRADDAQQAADAAMAAVQAKQSQISSLRDAIAEYAVNAYVNPPTEEFLDGFREANANEAARKKQLLTYRSGHDADLLDELRSAEAELDAAQRTAETAKSEAERQLGAVSSQLSQLQAAQTQQQQYANQVESRLDAKLGEAANLAATDATLSAEISKQEAVLAAQLRATAPPARTGGSGPAPGGGGGDGGRGGPITQVPAAPGLTTVGGITVASSVAGNLQSLLSAASAAGVSLSGSGYRDSSGQIALRRQNCGSSDYAVYQMPASQCSPETARPGLSKHERGLAVDFTSGGSTLRSGSAAHQWMVANAGSFGWVPLPGEPWHWSVGGG